MVLRLAAAAAVLSAASCGYHISGRADALPKTLHTIAIPAFGNVTTRYKLAERLTAATVREFITRTRYRVVADPGEADATLTGSLVNYFSFPTVIDQNTGRSTGVQVLVIVQITLTANDGTVIYSRPNFEVRERYEIAIDPEAYFDESEVAMDRLSRDVARTVVSAVLEKF